MVTQCFKGFNARNIISNSCYYVIHVSTSPTPLKLFDILSFSLRTIRLFSAGLLSAIIWWRRLRTMKYGMKVTTGETLQDFSPTSRFITCLFGCTTTQQGTLFFPDERGTQSGIDVAHGGQGILTWHRLYLLFFDRSLQKMTHDKSFTVPYWKWTENKETCTICTEKHLGVTNVTTGRVTGKYFTSWSVICTEEQTRGLTRMCNSSDEKWWLGRLNSKEKKGLEDRGFATTFPT